MRAPKLEMHGSYGEWVEVDTGRFRDATPEEKREHLRYLLEWHCLPIPSDEAFQGIVDSYPDLTVPK